MERMLTPQELQELRFSNAIEEFPYYDTFLISELIDNPDFAKYRQAGFLGTYAEVSAQAEIPFFKLRNRGSVGLPYTNMDVKDRFNLPFHCFGIGIQFVASSVSTGGDPNDQINGLLWSQELAKHCEFQFKVGQDEKLAINAQYLQAGVGNVGSYMQATGNSFSGNHNLQNGTNGRAARWNMYPFVDAEEKTDPIQIPRNETVEAKIVISRQGRAMLAGMIGPGSIGTQLGLVYQEAMIRVILVGVREVQLRNLQHF